MQDRCFALVTTKVKGDVAHAGGALPRVTGRLTIPASIGPDVTMWFCPAPVSIEAEG